MNAKGQGQRSTAPTINWVKLFEGGHRAALFCFGLVILGILPACRKRDVEAELRAAQAVARARFTRCTPQTTSAGPLRLALAEVKREARETSVRIVAYAVTEPADFDLPQYLMSRGRWLINERGRTYLLDAECYEYKLKDRSLTVGKTPPGGRIHLEAGESCELTLSFPRLPDSAREVVLVYGDWVMPFVLTTAEPQSEPGGKR